MYPIKTTGEIWRLRLFAILAASLPFTGGCSVSRAIRSGTGAMSHNLCAETFVSGLDPARTYAEVVRPAPGMGLISWGIRYHVDSARRQVRTSFLGGFASQAVHRSGMGCMLMHGTGAADTISPQEASAPNAWPAPLLPDIAGPALVEPTNEKLRAALDRAFAERDEPPYRHTRAVVIVRDGRVVAERYAPGIGIGTPLFGRSMTKSLVSTLVGILVRDGRLTVDQPAPVPEWQGADDPRHAITVDHLLRMTSGRAWGLETYSGWDPSSRMENLERDMAAYAAGFPLDAAPGSRWNYSAGDYLILSRIVRDAAGGHAADVLRFARHELFEPLGAHSMMLEFDATGTPAGSYASFATARDWARLGLLYLQDGVVGPRRVLPEGWARYVSTPTLATGYGAGFWTNRVIGTVPGRGIAWNLAGVPPDAFFCFGVLGQYVVVVPSERLVVVRLGVTWGRGSAREIAPLVTDVIAALR